MTRRAIGVSERPPLLQTIPLSLQHLFAMFGATVPVPVLFHINPATVLLFNGIEHCCISSSVKENSGLSWFQLCLYFTGIVTVAVGV